MKRNKVILLVTLALFVISCSGTGNRLEKISKSDLISDFDILYDYILRAHPMSFTNREDFVIFADSQRNKIGNMTKMEFVRFLTPILEKLKCGHTYLNFQPETRAEVYQGTHFLPFDIKVINNELFVFKDIFNNIEEGSQLLSINGRSDASITNTLLSSFPSDGDNQTHKEKSINSFVPFYYYYYLFIESPRKFRIEYSSPHSTVIQEMTIKPVGLDSLKLQYWNEEIENNSDAMSYMFYENFAELAIPTFDYYENTSYETFENQYLSFFSELKVRDIEYLILDLRGNLGGNPETASLLLTYLLEEPFTYFSDETRFNMKYKQEIKTSEISFSGDLYILIDGFSYSTAGHILSILRFKNRGIMIGQESGSGFLTDGFIKKVTLPSTGIVASIPTRAYSTSVAGQTVGRGIEPDIQVEYTINDYLDDTDLEMEIALQRIIVD